MIQFRRLLAAGPVPATLVDGDAARRCFLVKGEFTTDAVTIVDEVTTVATSTLFRDSVTLLTGTVKAERFVTTDVISLEVVVLETAS